MTALALLTVVSVLCTWRLVRLSWRLYDELTAGYGLLGATVYTLAVTVGMVLGSWLASIMEGRLV